MSLQEKIYLVKKKIEDKIKHGEIVKFLKESWGTTWPIMMIMFFEFFMNLTDVYISGLLGKEVKAAVGLSTQIYNFFIIIGHSISMGTVSVVSRLYSGNDKKQFHSAIFTSLTSSFVIGMIIAILGILLSSFIISLLNAPESVKEFCIPLLKIYSLGLFFHIIVININGILRSCKKVKITMYIMVLAAILNMAANIIFIKFTSLGYAGIAISTVVSLVAAFLIAAGIIYKLLEKTYNFSKHLLKQIVSIGWPSAVVSGCWQFGGTVLFAVLAMLPDSVEAMAAFTTGLRIEAAIFMPGFAFNMANAVIVGNLMGAKKFKEAYRAGMITAFLSVAAALFMVLIVILYARPITELLDKNTAVVNATVLYLYICMISEPFIAMNLAMNGALNGAGDTKANMIYAIVNVWIVRIPLAYLLGIFLGFGALGIWCALDIGFFVQSFLSTRRFMSGKWKELKI